MAGVGVLWDPSHLEMWISLTAIELLCVYIVMMHLACKRKKHGQQQATSLHGLGAPLEHRRFLAPGPFQGVPYRL